MKHHRQQQMVIRMSDIEPTLVTKIVREKEEGARIWEISESLGVPMTKVRAVIQEHAPHVRGNTMAVLNSWKAHKLSVEGKLSYREIGEKLGISGATAFRAAAIGMESFNRRRHSQAKKP